MKEEAKRLFGKGAVVRLFGSRLNDKVKGGDVDLLIEVKEVVDHPA
ncbi:MAG: nucleotidyltransferase domain-containing protein, partial [Thiotrichales bacterium]|nr:nucleotidyltransferase domain-containing protein [Thiotrichales bacterium]MBT5291075.1 nucleotidyltransferase domain-containing protein [Thiotrichales bacterium]